MNQLLIDQEVISRYIAQPVQLPAELRRRVEREWGGDPVQLYALADLDRAFRLAESWLLLGPRHVAMARGYLEGDSVPSRPTVLLGGEHAAAVSRWDIYSIERSRIQRRAGIAGPERQHAHAPRRA